MGFAKEVHAPLNEGLKKAVGIGGELEGQIRYSNHRAHALKLAGHPLTHANIGFSFIYTSDKPMPKHVNEDILPDVLEKYVTPYLETDKCTILREMHSSRYIRSLSKASEAEHAAVLDILQRDYPDVHRGFAKSILESRPPGAP